MRATSGLSGYVFSVWALLAVPPTLPAQDDDLRLQVLELRARLDVLTTERRLLDQPAGGSAAELLPESVQRRLRESRAGRRQTLEALAAECRRERDLTLASWRETNSAAEAASLRDDPTGPAAVFAASAIGFTPWLALGAAVGMLAAARAARLDLRRWLRSLGGAAGTMALLVLAVGCTELPSPPGPAAERAHLEGEHAQLSEQIQLAEKLIRQRRDAVLAGWGRTLAAVLGPEAKDRAEEFRMLDEEDDRLLHEALVATRTAERAVANQPRHAELDGRNRLLADVRTASRCGLITISILLALVPPWVVRRRVRRQVAQRARLCPCCLATDTLKKPVRGLAAADFASRCVTCNQCDYRLLLGYVRLSRLIFAAFGVRGSGKTHWLTTLYDLVKLRNVHVPAKFLPLPSVGDERFDLIMDMLRQGHVSGAVTQHQLPAPLTFSLRDTDPLGQNAILFNVSDVTGELAHKAIDVDTLRRQAAWADGFLFFLDPTRRGEEGGVEHQVGTLLNCCQDMRGALGLTPGDRIPVPVAVCVSKIDLLVTQNPLGERARPWIKSLRATAIDRLTLKTLQQRSQLCEQILPQMFPDLDLPTLLREHFGRSVLFFPLTPVGLEESELGVEDLSCRTVSPFGIAEPILWLLHMQGYCLFR